MNAKILSNNASDQHITSGTPKHIAAKKEQSLTIGKNRQTLKTIQPTANTKTEPNLKSQIKINMNRLTPKRVNVYRDPEPKLKSTLCSEIDNDAYSLMVEDNPPETYWKEVAEQRRLALTEALDENEKLHRSVDKLLKENGELQYMADQAEYFSGIIKTLLEDQNDSGVGSDLHTTHDESQLDQDESQLDQDESQLDQDESQLDQDESHLDQDESQLDQDESQLDDGEQSDK